MIAPIRSPRGPFQFPLGQIVATPAALKALEEAGEDGSHFLGRHHSGDWGDVGAEDAHTNELALKEGDRILSAYHTTKGVKLWIITEADRSSTCLLLPEDY
jgi:hypothetical protein